MSDRYYWTIAVDVRVMIVATHGRCVVTMISEVGSLFVLHVDLEPRWLRLMSLILLLLLVLDNLGHLEIVLGAVVLQQLVARVNILRSRRRVQAVQRGQAQLLGTNCRGAGARHVSLG